MNDYVLLLDIYGDLLAKSQREALDLKYNSDLSLAEIAEEMGGISRQSVNYFLNKGRKRLSELEEVVGSAARFRAVSDAVGEAKDILNNIRADSSDERLKNLDKALEKIKLEINS